MEFTPMTSFSSTASTKHPSGILEPRYSLSARWGKNSLIIAFLRSPHPDRQRMPEHIQRVPPRLDPLQARVVSLVIQGGPRNAGRIQGGVREIGVGMIDERPIVGLARDRDAAGLREQIAIERTHPGQILRLVRRVQPARG